MKTLKTMFIAGWLAVLVCPGWAAAAPGAEGKMNALPTYTLPDSAAADGKLAEWAGIPPSATAGDWTKDDPALQLYAGMKPGGRELFFLIMVRDRQRYGDGTPPTCTAHGADALVLCFDFDRQARDTSFADWQDNSKRDIYGPQTVRGAPTGRIVLTPRSWSAQPKTIPDEVMTYWQKGIEANIMVPADWKAKAISVPVEGGTAYEVSVNLDAVLSASGRKASSDYIGFSAAVVDQDNHLPLGPLNIQPDRINQWRNWAGERSTSAYSPISPTPLAAELGILSLSPVKPAAPAPQAPLPQSLQDVYGEFPGADAIGAGIGKPDPEKLADLVFWAAVQGAVLDAPLVKKLMAAEAPLVRENTLAALFFTDQDKAAAEMGASLAYGRDVATATSNELILACLVNEKYGLGHLPELRRLLASDDLTVAVAAAQALVKVGVKDDIAVLEAAIDERERLLLAKNPQMPGIARMGRPLLAALSEALQLRVAPNPSKATLTREILKANTDLNRFIPWDGNTVFNAVGLLRQWPKEGPRELWRFKAGPALAAVVEAGGRTFVGGQSEGKQWAHCLDAKTGKELWKTETGEEFFSGGHWWGTVSSPVVDGDRVYFIPGGDRDKKPEKWCSMLCLRISDGKVLWRSGGDIPYVNGFSTPLVIGDTVYVLPNVADLALLPLDRLTGKVRSQWPPFPLISRGTPVVGASPTYQELDGIGQIVTGWGSSDGSQVAGCSPKDGTIFWRVGTSGGYGIFASPVAVGRRIFLTYGRHGGWSRCLEMQARGGKIRSKEIYKSVRNQVNLYNSPAIIDGAVYGFNDSALQCTSLDDGKVLWEQKGWGNAGQLIAADGLIFALSGELVMLEVNRTGYNELGRFHHRIELGHPQHPTLANGRLYVHGLDTTICYQLTPELLGSAPDTSSSPPVRVQTEQERSK
jgi:outer membrane protein assembly factor BamB